MPNCQECGDQTPITNFFQVRQVDFFLLRHHLGPFTEGDHRDWDFCSYECMAKWIEEHGVCNNCERLVHQDKLMEGIVCYDCVAAMDRKVEEETARAMLHQATVRLKGKSHLAP